MKHKPEYAVKADVRLLALATALVNYAESIEHLKCMCASIWPECDFYRGGTHVRVLIEGTSFGKSFYVETV